MPKICDVCGKIECECKSRTILLTEEQYLYLTHIVGEFKNTMAMGLTYGDWIVLNELLVAVGMEPRDFSDDPDYEDVRKSLRGD